MVSRGISQNIWKLSTEEESREEERDKRAAERQKIHCGLEGFMYVYNYYKYNIS